MRMRIDEAWRCDFAGSIQLDVAPGSIEPANFHDAICAHANVALKASGPAAIDNARMIRTVGKHRRSRARQGANAISIHGTSLTFYKGAAFNNDLIAQVAKATGLPTTSMSRGIVEGLKAVGAKRVAVATAYNETVNGRLRVFLEESGFEVLGVKGMGIERFEDRPPVTQEELFNLGATAYASMSKADTLLISCGALNTLRLLDPLEKKCKVPVVSSAPHALWAGVRLLGLSGQAKGYGRLLSRA